MNLVENNWRVGSFFYTLRLRRCHRGSHLPKKFFSYFSSGIDLHSDKNCDLGSDKNCDLGSDKDCDLGSDKNCDLASDKKSDKDLECDCDLGSDKDLDCDKDIKNTPNTLSIWGLFISH